MYDARTLRQAGGLVASGSSTRTSRTANGVPPSDRPLRRGGRAACRSLGLAGLRQGESRSLGSVGAARAGEMGGRGGRARLLRGSSAHYRQLGRRLGGWRRRRRRRRRPVSACRGRAPEPGRQDVQSVINLSFCSSFHPSRRPSVPGRLPACPPAPVSGPGGPSVHQRRKASLGKNVVAVSRR